MEEQEVQQVEQPQVEEATGGVTTEQEETSSDVITEAEVPEEQEVKNVDPDFYKNRWAEAQRKLENREKQLEEVLTRVDQKLTQKDTPQYSVDELEAFMEQTDNDQHRMWAKKEIRKLQQQEQANLVRQELTQFQKQQQAEQIKQRSFQEVISRNPDLIQTDPAGNFVGWNENSPMFRNMQRYLSDPRIQGQPDGLAIAEKLALADMYMSQKPKTQKAINDQKEQIKNLQKRTMVEGGVNQDTYVPSPEDSAMADLQRTGSLKDAARVFALRRK